MAKRSIERGVDSGDCDAAGAWLRPARRRAPLRLPLRLPHRCFPLLGSRRIRPLMRPRCGGGGDDDGGDGGGV